MNAAVYDATINWDDPFFNTPTTSESRLAACLNEVSLTAAVFNEGLLQHRIDLEGCKQFVTKMSNASCWQEHLQNIYTPLERLESWRDRDRDPQRVMTEFRLKRIQGWQALANLCKESATYYKNRAQSCRLAVVISGVVAACFLFFSLQGVLTSNRGALSKDLVLQLCIGGAATIVSSFFKQRMLCYEDCRKITNDCAQLLAQRAIFHGHILR